jgi:hypothetical protein
MSTGIPAAPVLVTLYLAYFEIREFHKFAPYIEFYER